MKKTIHWRKCVTKKYPIEFEGSIRKLARDINEDFTYLSKIFRGYACSEEKAKQIIDKVKKINE